MTTLRAERDDWAAWEGYLRWLQSMGCPACDYQPCRSPRPLDPERLKDGHRP